jgi:phenylalanyl-tRNA synthetase beta chain
MKIPLSWLREYVDVSVEPARLGEDLTFAGLELASIEPVDDDTVLDFEITTNRVDCMNVYGVARETAVLYGLPLRPLETTFAETGAAASNALEVVVEAPDLCPRFCARVLDVKLGRSPGWLQRRLEAVGVRPINNIVDVTNYVMMEMGHPTHAFDWDEIPEHRLRVRWARAGERLVTLDGQQRTLSERCGLVAGPDQGLALAGVMGGASSEVSDVTRVVALEAAYWQPLAIRRAAKDAGIRTEASHRFERGADPEAPPVALARIAHLLGKIGAGSVRPGLIDVRPVPSVKRTASLRQSRLRTLLGVDVPSARVRETLEGLGFRAQDAAADAATFEIPSWRGDVSREVDLVEEVGRHFGVNKVPSTLPAARTVGGLRPWQRRERELRRLLAGAGLTEVITYAFVAGSASDAVARSRVALANPLSEEQDVLRASIVVPGLLGVLGANLRRGQRDVAVFEMGRIFGPGIPLPEEERCLGLLLHGAARSVHWSEKPRPVDVFDAKGFIEAVGAHFQLSLSFTREGALPPYLHPGRAALIQAGGASVGFVGALHPDFLERWGWRDDVIVAEMTIESLLATDSVRRRYEPLPRYPAVQRDVSVVCAEHLPAGEIDGLLRGAGGEHLDGVQLVDRYAGAQVGEGKVSLTYSLRFRNADRTLTSDEVESAMERVAVALRGAGCEIRGV